MIGGDALAERDSDARDIGKPLHDLFGDGTIGRGVDMSAAYIRPFGVNIEHVRGVFFVGDHQVDMAIAWSCIRGPIRRAWFPDARSKVFFGS